MPTQLERFHMTESSETVVSNRLPLRVKADPPTWVIVSPYGPMHGKALSAQPIQSEGGSSQSREIESRLASVLADIRDAESESPRQIRMTSPRQLGAAQMDPWVAKNERRLRLIEKKHAAGLSWQEARELDRLKREVYNHLQSVDPRSTDALDEIDSRLESLKKKLEATRCKKG